ncbi:GAF domain-containing protein [Streptomyces sp. NPDC058128]|uniref:GAF domain-containing protein n=1 Tax=Streptomyces sp. NPDC058128 TaxID=3346352 RepID=UPI0036F06E61
MQARHLGGATSAVIAPLRARREVLGVLTVSRSKDHPVLTKEDLPLLDDLAHRVGPAVENARLHRETQRIANVSSVPCCPSCPASTACGWPPATPPLMPPRRSAATGTTASCWQPATPL